MNTRFQKNQRIVLVPLMFSFALTILLSSVTSGQGLIEYQINPNPNPVGNTIIVNDPIDPNTNFEDFNNQGTIHIETTGVLYNFATLDNSGVILNESNFFNYDVGAVEYSATVNNSGTITNIGSGGGGLMSSASFMMYGGTVNNYGDIINEDWGGVGLNGDAVLNNYSNITNQYGTILLGLDLGFDNFDGTPGTIINYGTIDNQDSGCIIGIGTSGAVVNEAGGHISNAGRIGNQGEVLNEGTFDNTSGTFLNAGMYQGTGTFVGTLDTGIGTVAPGNSAGTMFVDGDYTLADYIDDPEYGSGTGTLEIEIGGFDAGESDFLDITGKAFLTGGTVNFSFIDGYDIIADIPDYGDSLSWMFLEADLGIDSFASTDTYDFLGTPAGFVYDVYQLDNSLYFEATNMIPAPGAVLLGSLGIGFVSLLLKRRRP